LTLTKQNISILLVLCEKGNQLAQLEVYNRYQQAMYNTALRIVNDTAEAEDVMQDSFITAFNKLGTIKDPTTFGSWLKRIVINNSISQYNKSKRFVSLNDEVLIPNGIGFEGEEETLSDNISIGTDVDYSNTKIKEVIKCLKGLNKNYNQILTLHFIEGFDYEEICEILNISYANCRTMISRAKESLRNKLIVAK